MTSDKPFQANIPAVKADTSLHLKTHAEKRGKEENEPRLLSKPQKIYLILKPSCMGAGSTSITRLTTVPTLNFSDPQNAFPPF